MEDAHAICKIYNPIIKNTTISFEEKEVSILEMQDRIRRINESHLWLVYEVDSVVKGYAYASTWRGRPAYRFSVETAIYISDELKGQGIGSLLYKNLLDNLHERGIQLVVGVVAGENPSSEKLHSKMEFTKVGTFKNAGNKLGKWVDVTFYQKNI
jgi:phosphinothricin acetyltransferase